MRLYNVDPSPVVVVQNERAVMPCQGFDFSAEQIAAGIAGSWSEQDPRRGKEQERAFKARRDASAAGRDQPKKE